MKKTLKWYNNLVKFHKSKYKQIPISSCKNWKSNKNKISHNSKLFFEIIGLETVCENKKNGRRNWTQPIFREKNYKGGILGFVKKKLKERIIFYFKENLNQAMYMVYK